MYVYECRVNDTLLQVTEELCSVSPRFKPMTPGIGSKHTCTLPIWDCKSYMSLPRAVMGHHDFFPTRLYKSRLVFI